MAENKRTKATAINTPITIFHFDPTQVPCHVLMNATVRKVILLIIAAAGVYLVGNGRTSLFDRDEPRYAQCSRQMLQSGDWVVPHLYDKIRAAKPPGIYWCQATAMKLFGDNAFAARFPSSLAMILTLTLLALTLWRAVGPSRTLWTLFVFSSTALVIFASKMAMTDSVLLLCTIVAQLCIYSLWQRRRQLPAVIVISTAIGFGGLIKGPFILGVLAGTVIMLGLLRLLDHILASRRDRSLTPPSEVPLDRFPLSYQSVSPTAHASPPDLLRILSIGAQIIMGILIVSAIVLPWVYMVSHREPLFLHAAARDAQEHLEKGSEGHVGPPGYHLVLIWGTYLPWSLLLPLAIVMAFKNRQDPNVRFALASVLGAWVFAEVLSTKLPHYILPAMPGLAFLTADAIVRCLSGQSDALKARELRIAAGIIAVVILAAAIVPWWWLAISFHDFPWIALLLLALVGIGYAFAVWFFFHTQRPALALISMGTGSMALGITLFGVYFPSATPLRLSIRTAKVLTDNGVTHPGQSLMLDYKEPSLAFYQGGTIREAKHSLPVVQDLKTAPPWLVMTREIWNQAGPEARAQMEIIGTPLRGYNYSDSLRPADLFIVKNHASRTKSIN
ncbi:MAG TPA: glycosyltransferase family 39 protein [Tepidisphaeraceae bacterium]